MSLSHRCERGRRCARAEREPDGRVVGAALEAPYGLCGACERRVQAAIRSLPRLYVELERMVGYHPARSLEPVSGTREPPIPLRVDVVSLQQSIDTTAAMWAAPIARRRRIPWDATASAQLKAGARLQRAAAVLAANLDALLALPYAEFHARSPLGVAITTRYAGIEGALELLDLYEEGVHLVTGGDGHARLPVPCPSCQGTLIRPNGSDEVVCLECGRARSDEDYHALCRELVEQYR